VWREDGNRFFKLGLPLLKERFSFGAHESALLS